MAFQPHAKVIADSVNNFGDRLTTIEVELHRFILSEFNTHRAFSRNSASSRAIPFAKMRAKALNSPALPLSWPSEQKGMQGGEELPETDQIAAEIDWLDGRDRAVETADRLHKRGLHKSVINRLLEPFLPHKVIVSATDWQGFWEQRCHPDAQPEIRVAAEAMKKVYDESKPKLLAYGEFHLPYITDEDREQYGSKWTTHDGALMNRLALLHHNPLLKISAARCARVSYETHDGKRDLAKDLELFDRLHNHRPAHASPLEHPARGLTLTSSAMWHTKGNFTGFQQLRHLLGLR